MGKISQKSIRYSLFFIILLALTFVVALTLGCCEKRVVPRDVELVLINSNTGEPLKNGDTIELPEEQTEIEVMVKDKETGKVLTDDDIKFKTVRSSIHTSLETITQDGRLGALVGNSFWPTWEEIYKVFPTDISDEYKMTIRFDCRPDQVGPNYVRYYNNERTYIRFYIIVPNNEGENDHEN